MLAQEDWDVVRFPALAEEDELYRLEAVFGRQAFGRKAGEASHPEREPPEMLAQLRRTLGEYPPALRPGGCRPVQAGPDAIGRRHGQSRVV